MRANYYTLFAASFVSLMLVSSSLGQTIFDEAIDGELSNSGLTPTAVALGLGTNTIVGNFGNNGQTGATNGNDGDFFTFTLLSGCLLYTSPSPRDRG